LPIWDFVGFLLIRRPNIRRCYSDFRHLQTKNEFDYVSQSRLF
jgi:hypothetical protein